MAVGIWTIVDKSYLENVMRNSLYMSAAYTLIAVGAITIIISFLGCMGSFAVSLIYYSINICKAVPVYYIAREALIVYACYGCVTENNSLLFSFCHLELVILENIRFLLVILTNDKHKMDYFLDD